MNDSDAQQAVGIQARELGELVEPMYRFLRLLEGV